MKTTLLSFLLAAILAFTSCSRDKRWVSGSGPLVTETRSITGFSGLETNIASGISYVQDSIYKIEISAQQNLLDLLETDISGSVLRIRWAPFTVVRRSLPISITIHAPRMSQVRINGSSIFKAASIRENGNVLLSVNGSGHISITEMNAKSLISSINGSGDIYIEKGRAESGDHSVNGSGNIITSGFETRNCHAGIGGSGYIEVFASENLTAEISGSGEIRYKGRPQTSQKISGSGRVRRM